MSRNPNLEKYEKTNVFATVDSVTETTKDFYKDKKSSISEEFSNVAGQIQQHEKMRIYEQFLQEESLHSHQKPDAHWYTNNLKRPPELSLQETNVNSLGVSDFNKNLGHKDFLPKKKKRAEAKKQKRNFKMRDQYAYRLIDVVSHLGNTLHSGHYISDAFDFERQA